MASRLFTILFFTFLVTPTFAGTPTKRQATISGTPIQSNPLGIPTLAYNCAKLPSICQNINRRNPIANNGQGVLLNIPYLELHYDTNPQRIDDRRNAACPKTWKSSHACPESNQPLVVRDGDSLDVGISGQLLNPGSGSYQISDPSGAFLGLIWTCNDWPPAMSTLEGGSNAQTYCAPQAAACAGKNDYSVQSEQDFQSFAHSALRRHIWSSPIPPAGIYIFHFVTGFLDQADAPATMVYYNESGGEFRDIFGVHVKRSENSSYFDINPPMKYQVTEHHYTNGTTEVFRKAIPHESQARQSNLQPKLDARATSIAGGVTLRILPLGDSITYGFQSSDGNGYRLDLENLLSGNPVNFIGSLMHGTMADNHNEGHSGATIAQIAGYATASLPDRPNIVLLHAGTNDMNDVPPVDPVNAPARLGAMIDSILAACPDAAVLVAQIIPASSATTNALIQTYNAAIPGVVQARASAGKHVLLVDMYDALTQSDLSDGLHPNDGGYAKMAGVWLAGIGQAAGLGWVRTPVQVPNPVGGGGVACSGNPIWLPQGEIATGLGAMDMTFSTVWLPQGQVSSGAGSGSHVRFGDIDGDGRDDYLFVYDSGAVDLYLNTLGPGGNIVWVPYAQIATGIPALDGAGVRFADVNGDGRDDYLWLDPQGAVTAYINTPGTDPAHPIWVPWGNILSSLGGTRDQIRFGDIDGDGYDDVLQIGADGSVLCFLNIPTGGGLPNWYDQGIIASGIGEDGQGVHIADINGDGRDDYLWLYKNGTIAPYLNIESQTDGQPTWLPQAIIPSGVGISRDNITFADLNGDSKADYVFLDDKSGAVTLWLNTGSGRTEETGQGILFADLNGDGRDEYLFVDEDGTVTAYLNLGGSNPGQPGWLAQGVIANGVGAKQHQIRFADINGDGRVEYLVVDDTTGAVTSWANEGSPQGNNGPDAGKVVWAPQGTIATGAGVGKGVRFADINGDGRADYVWLDENGAATVFINAGGPDLQHPAWVAQGVVAAGVGAVRGDVRFEDINGDGLDDYLWLNRLDGSVQAWINGGLTGQGEVTWYPRGIIATGVGTSGQVIAFGDLNGDERVEYLEITPSTGAVAAWLNGCQELTNALGSGGPVSLSGLNRPVSSPMPTTTPLPLGNDIIPPDPNENAPHDENQAILDQACALEYGLPLASYVPITATTGPGSPPTPTYGTTTLGCQVCVFKADDPSGTKCTSVPGCAAPTLAMMPTATPAHLVCVTLQGEVYEDPLEGDSVLVQHMVVDGVERCADKGYTGLPVSASGTDNETVYNVDCGGGYSFSITGNGSNATYHGPDGDSDIPTTSKSSDEICYDFEGTEWKCTIYSFKSNRSC